MPPGAGPWSVTPRSRPGNEDNLGSGLGLEQATKSPDRVMKGPAPESVRGLLAFQSGRPDLNRGPPAPEAGALTGLRHAPMPHALRGTRTPSLLIRSQMLYPIEL
jgi:hypothetical protein